MKPNFARATFSLIARLIPLRFVLAVAGLFAGTLTVRGQTSIRIHEVSVSYHWMDLSYGPYYRPDMTGFDSPGSPPLQYEFYPVSYVVQPFYQALTEMSRPVNDQFYSIRFLPYSNYFLGTVVGIFKMHDELGTDILLQINLTITNTAPVAPALVYDVPRGGGPFQVLMFGDGLASDADGDPLFLSQEIDYQSGYGTAERMWFPQQYIIFTQDPNAPLTAYSSAFTYTIYDGYTFTTSTITFNVPAAIPEPGTCAAMLGGCAGLVALWRRRRRVA